MRILAIERELPTPRRADLPHLLHDEAAGVWDLQKRGIIRDIWFTTAEQLAIIMLECANAAEAREHLATLPLVQTGVIDFTLHELRSYDGFERLFATVGAEPPVHLHQEPPEY
jgi:muconolactone delta-isomerase